jgi:hypothetical protein
MKFKLLKYILSLIEPRTCTMAIFTNFKYFNILCVITCEKDKDWVLRFTVKKDPWLA